jgi:hypothetical protein
MVRTSLIERFGEDILGDEKDGKGMGGGLLSCEKVSEVTGY